MNDPREVEVEAEAMDAVGRRLVRGLVRYCVMQNHPGVVQAVVEAGLLSKDDLSSDPVTRTLLQQKTLVQLVEHGYPTPEWEQYVPVMIAFVDDTRTEANRRLWPVLLVEFLAVTALAQLSSNDPGPAVSAAVDRLFSMDRPELHSDFARAVAADLRALAELIPLSGERAAARLRSEAIAAAHSVANFRSIFRAYSKSVLQATQSSVRGAFRVLADAVDLFFRATPSVAGSHSAMAALQSTQPGSDSSSTSEALPTPMFLPSKPVPAANHSLADPTTHPVDSEATGSSSNKTVRPVYVLEASALQKRPRTVPAPPPPEPSQQASHASGRHELMEAAAMVAKTGLAREEAQSLLSTDTELGARFQRLLDRGRPAPADLAPPSPSPISPDGSFLHNFVQLTRQLDPRPSAGPVPRVSRLPPAETDGVDDDDERRTPSVPAPDSAPRGTGPKHRRRFSPEEDRAILEGVVRYGVGAWAQILADDELNGPLKAAGRSSVNLKDRYRNLGKDIRVV